MVLYDGLDVVASSRNKARLDIVCVHSLGLRPETTWHDGTSGKAWTEELEYLATLCYGARVLSFRYNSDIDSNMSAASLAIHANDLLFHLEMAMAQSDGIGLVFVGHGLGGIIIKKALRLCQLAEKWPRVRDSLTGVVFFATPHTDSNSEALLQAIRNNVQLLRRNHSSVEEDDLRELASTVGSINSSYNKTKLGALESISFWEDKPSTWTTQGGEVCSDVVIPKSCQGGTLSNNKDIVMDCSYLDMPHFSSLFDTRFRSFAESFSALVSRILRHKPFVIQSSKLSSSPRSSTSVASKRRRRGRPTARHRSRSDSSESSDSETGDDQFALWQKRKAYEDHAARLAGFLQSLNGWSSANMGRDVFVAPGTCEYMSHSPGFKVWFENAVYGSFFWLAEPGAGKTHLAKAVAGYIEALRPKEVVLSFFAQKETLMPPIWEYFTWSLLQARPLWFSSVPKQYQSRNADSPRLSTGEFIDIWTAIRRTDRQRRDTIWLVIDGLEQCGHEVFLEFWRGLEQLRKRQANPSGQTAVVKVLLTGTLTPAMISVAQDTSRYFVSSEWTREDIARYVDARLDQAVASSGVSAISAKVNAHATEIKAVAEDYWPFARHAVSEIEVALGEKQARVPSFRKRLPIELECHVRQTVLSLQQSIGPDRYLYPALSILLGCTRGIRPDIYQLKDALLALYDSNELRDLDMADALLSRCGGLFTYIAGGSIYFRHWAFANFLARGSSSAQRDGDLAYVCMRYLLQDCFATMPLPKDVKDPAAWLDKHHPFYSYALLHTFEYLAGASSEDGRLGPLFLQLFLKNPPQLRTARCWAAIDPDSIANWDICGDFPMQPVLMIQTLLPFLVQVCPPPPDFSGQSALSAAQSKCRAWLANWRRQRPLYDLPEGWLAMRDRGDYTPLLFAASRGNVDVMRYLLNWNPDVNERGGRPRRSVLMTLCCNRPEKKVAAGDVLLLPITEELCRRGADLSWGDEHGGTPLHVACHCESLALARLLLDNGANLNIADRRGVTAWEIAGEGENIELVRELVARGADVDGFLSNGETMLTYLTSRGKVDMLRAILPSANVNARNVHGAAAIHVAMQCEVTCYQVLDLLISQPGIDLDALQPVTREADEDLATALSIAITRVDYRSVEMLLRAGASAGSLPGLVILPLQCAVREGNRDIVEVLLRHRAPVNGFIFPHKETALACACWNGHTEIVRLLLDHGADPTVDEGLQLSNAAWWIVDSECPNVEILKLLLECAHPPSITEHYGELGEKVAEYSSLFMLACEHEQTEITRLLLDCGIDLSVWLKTTDTYSPLHAAAAAGNVEQCRLLLDEEPRLLDHATTVRGAEQTPLHEACRHGKSEVVKLLLDKGADLYKQTTIWERSCLSHACTSGDHDTVKVVLDALGADKSMLTQMTYRGTRPLLVASNLCEPRTTEELLKAGVDANQANLDGHTAVCGQLLEHSDDQKVITLLRLLIKYGLDINRPSGVHGWTPFYIALSCGSPAVVRWLSKHGGDLSYTGRTPTLPSIFRDGLLVMAGRNVPDLIDEILNSQRERLDETDWSGQNALGYFSRGWRPYLARLHWLCEEIRAETGRDIFAEMMVLPNVFGICAVDRALGARGCHPENRAAVARVSIDLLDAYLGGQSDLVLLQVLMPILMDKLDYRDADGLRPLMTLQHSRPGVKCINEKAIMQAATTDTLWCAYCQEETFDKVFVCLDCPDNICMQCMDTSQLDPCEDDKDHSLIEVPLSVSLTKDSAEAQEACTKVRAFLLSVIDEEWQDALSESSTVCDRDEEDDKGQLLQASLQLATLHSLNMLAIRKPMWTTHLPLSSCVLDLISPFEGNIAEMRKGHERRMLDGEMTVERRKEEMRYMNRGMSRMSYADEGQYRRDMMLSQMAGLFGD